MALRRLVIGFLVCVPLVPNSTARGEDFVEVTVTGEGISEDSAMKDALRKALEQGGRVEISSHSEVDNFELIRDTVYSKAEGLVTDYKVLSKGPAAGGIFYCEIRAKVSKSAIASTWGQVQNVLDQLGRPGVAVYILERIDGVVQDSSILESQIENKLVNVGFDVYAGEHIRRIAEKESGDAELEGNMAKIQAIAKNFGTQIFITGTAQANAAGVSNIANQQVAMYNGDCMIKMYYTDSGKLLASESIPNWRGGARGKFTHSPQAGKMALSNAGRDIVDVMYNNVMKQWATQISSGGEIVLEVEGVKMGDAIRLKKYLKQIDADKVKNVNQTFSKGVARFKIKAQFTAGDFVDFLVEAPFSDMIEVVDMQGTRIQAKKVGG